MTFLERRWPTVILTPISVANHIITVSSVNGLHTKQKITLRLGGNALTDLEIKRVVSATQIQVGPIGSEMGNIINPVAYNGGTLEMHEQERNKVGNEITFRAVYMEEPAVALRNILVDRLGEPWSSTNPLPVDAVVNIGDITVGVDGVYNNITNTNPASTGVVGHERTASPGDIDQTNRITSVTNGTVHALDVAIQNSNGSAIDTTNPLPVTKQNSFVVTKFDDIILTRNAQGQLMNAEYKKLGSTTATVVITRNPQGQITRATRTPSA